MQFSTQISPEFVERLKCGDDKAWQTVVTEIGGELTTRLRFRYPYLRPFQIDDVLADAIATAWEKIDSFELERAPLVAWVMGIAERLTKKMNASDEVTVPLTEAAVIARIAEDEIGVPPESEFCRIVSSNLTEQDRLILEYSVSGRPSWAKDLSKIIPMKPSDIRVKNFRLRDRLALQFGELYARDVSKDSLSMAAIDEESC